MIDIYLQDVEVYAKQTQTDAVRVQDRVSVDVDEGDEPLDSVKQDGQGIGTKGDNKDDTIEPEKQVYMCDWFE